MILKEFKELAFLKCAGMLFHNLVRLKVTIRPRTQKEGAVTKTEQIGYIYLGENPWQPYILTMRFYK